MNAGKPYISFVAASRNDGHGGDILLRMTLFVKGLIHQCNRFQLPCELILVEWNPPADKPRLNEVLPLPAEGDYLRLRFIEVPAHIHEQYVRAKTIPLFQMIAKNVGIRRAKADFICATNVDLLFSDALFARLARQNLEKKYFYRASRWDMNAPLSADMDFDAQIAFANNHILRRLGRNRKYPYLLVVPDPMKRFHPFAPLKNAWEAFKLWLTAENAQHIALRLLDTDACGDFTLMHREAWARIRGYLELDLYSIHIDTLALIQAASLGYSQYIFPYEACTYHMDHPLGWEAMDTFGKIRFWQERPGLGYDVVWGSAMHMLKDKTEPELNSEDWGFGRMQFEEQTF